MRPARVWGGALEPVRVHLVAASCRQPLLRASVGSADGCLCFSFQAERPALNVVIFPLLHEGLTDVIRDVPMVHLDEITLFKSRVAEEPPNLWW